MMYIDDMRDLETKVLTISGAYIPPKGGMSQIVYNYDKYIFKTFYHVPNGKDERSLASYAMCLVHPLRMLCFFVLHPSIRIVHIHTCSNNTFKHSAITARFAKLFGKKVVMHMHGGGFKEYYENNKSFVKQQIRNIDGVVALSQSWREFYSDVVGMNNVCVVPNIVPEPRMLKNENKSRKLTLLYLGHIYKAKGIFDLVELINANREYYVGRLQLNIGGGMYDVDKLNLYISDNNLGDIVKMCGWVLGDEKAELLSNSDAFILPSYAEGQPVSIIEAMSYGLPILSTNVGGIPEMVADGENGFLFEPGDKDKMKEYIDLLLNNMHLREQMSIKSRELSLQYMPDSVREKLFQLYNQLL